MVGVDVRAEMMLLNCVSSRSGSVKEDDVRMNAAVQEWAAA